MARIREESVEKVTGKATFTIDRSLPNTAYGRLLGSPHVHARILSIDTSEAEALPGVYAVVTGEDFMHIIRPGEVLRDQPPLALGNVRHMDEPVAAVAAVDEATADEALSLIHVEYEPLPVVGDMDGALAPGAPLIHETLAPIVQETLPPGAPKLVVDGQPVPGGHNTFVSGSNVYHHTYYEKGNVEQGFAEADHIFEDEFYFPRVFHYPMEPTSVLVEETAEGITVWSASQGPFGVQDRLAQVFGLPTTKVRVISSYLGSGFGGRGGQAEIIAVGLCRKAGVPVKLVYTFPHDMVATRRPAFKARLKTGVKRDGTIVVSQVETWADGGAYARRIPWIVEVALSRFFAGYRTPHLRLQAHSVYTNTASCSTYRSPGSTQLGWAREVQFDMIARKLGIDPMEFRHKNLLKRGEESALVGTRPIDGDLPGDIQKIAKAFGWEKPPRPGRGRGLAVGVSGASAGPPSSAIVRLRSDGTLTVVCSGVEMGQGMYTAMRRIAAWELGVPMEQVRVTPVIDTAASPFEAGTGGSRGTVMTGLSVQMATRDVKEQLLAIAAAQFNVPVASLVIRDGMVAGPEEQVVRIAQVMQRYFMPPVVQPWVPGIVSQLSGVSRSAHPQGRGEIIGRASIAPGWEDSRLDLKPAFWETGMGAAEVEVDRETGLVKLVRYMGLADAGRIFDEHTAKGQVEGAAMQALGFTLGEEMLYDDGVLVNNTLMNYRVTQFEDAPDEFEAILVENGDGVGAFGSKGMGQIAAAIMAPAVTNAIGQLTGVYMHILPITPQRVWEALRTANKEARAAPLR